MLTALFCWAEYMMIHDLFIFLNASQQKVLSMGGGCQLLVSGFQIQCDISIE